MPDRTSSAARDADHNRVLDQEVEDARTPSAASTEVILIGRPASPITDASERLLDGFIVAMQEFDTETLLAIADDREEINPDGWMQKCIWGYVEVWR